MKTVGIIFSNIHDKEIKELTSNRTLASVHFGGRYRLVDFALSNMTNSGVTKVGIITKSNFQSLMEHVGSGRSWDLSRKNGGVMLLPPFGNRESKVYNSRFEALSNAIGFLKGCSEEFVVMTDCDNVCNIDYQKVIDYHIEKHADITVVYRKKHLPTANDKVRTQFTLDEDGRVIKTVISKKHELEVNKFSNIFVINRTFLLNILENADDLGYTSFSRDVMIKGVDMYRIYGYEFTGYYASIDSLANYYKHSMELLVKENRDALFRSGGAIFTRVRDSAPCRFEDGGNAKNSLIADGCVIEGSVENSILFRGVHVQKGAVVKNSILMQDVIVGEDTQLNCVIADKNVQVLKGRLLSGHSTHPYFITRDSIV